MNQARAFSDKEIITIAAVAASALGGIVIGLGRGQEDRQAESTSTRKIQEGVSRALDTTATRAQALQVRELPVSIDDVRRAYEEARPAARSAARKASESVNTSARPAVASAVERVQSEGKRQSSSISELVKSLVASAVETGLSNVSAPDKDKLKSSVSTFVERFGEKAGRVEAESEDNSQRVADRISESTRAVEENLAAAPDLARAARDQSKEVVRQRVAEPVSRAASKTGDVTKESLAALVWLSLGTAVVYFGLLSDERREQVKAGICGAIEQGRLLMLDLQGYEPEM